MRARRSRPKCEAAIYASIGDESATIDAAGASGRGDRAARARGMQLVFQESAAGTHHAHDVPELLVHAGRDERGSIRVRRAIGALIAVLVLAGVAFTASRVQSAADNKRVTRALNQAKTEQHRAEVSAALAAQSAKVAKQQRAIAMQQTRVAVQQQKLAEHQMAHLIAAQTARTACVAGKPCRAP